MRLAILDLLVLFACSARVIADRNITIDDADWTRIQYFPSDKWTSVRGFQTADRYDGTTSFTTTQGAYATFSFSGALAFYFMGYGILPQGPLGTIAIEFDGQSSEVPESIDPARSAQQILFSRTGLDVSRQYTFIVRKTSLGGGEHDLNVDAMIYTVPDGASDSEGEGRHGISVGKIAGGVVGGVCVGVLILGAWLRMRYKRQNQVGPQDPAPYILPLHARSSSFEVGGKQAGTRGAAPVSLSSNSRPGPLSVAAPHTLSSQIPDTQLPPPGGVVALTQPRQFSPPPYST